MLQVQFEHTEQSPLFSYTSRPDCGPWGLTARTGPEHSGKEHQVKVDVSGLTVKDKAGLHPDKNSIERKPDPTRYRRASHRVHEKKVAEPSAAEGVGEGVRD